jgi:hypothetical protein
MTFANPSLCKRLETIPCHPEGYDTIQEGPILSHTIVEDVAMQLMIFSSPCPPLCHAEQIVATIVVSWIWDLWLIPPLGAAD